MPTKLARLHRPMWLRSSFSLFATALLLFALSQVLSGCSAGGRSAEASGSGDTATAKAATMSVTLVDSSGASTTNLAAGAPLSVRINLRDGNGNAIANAVVEVSSSNEDVGKVSPSTVLTDGTGTATATLNAASADASGAGYVTATYTGTGSSGTSASASAAFQANAASVSLALAATSTSLSAYGTTTISATVTVNGAPPATPATVQFNSICVANGKATLATSAQTVNGIASVTYTDKGCGQTDTVTATVGSSQRSIALTIASPLAGGIQFVGATRSFLVLRGTGGEGYSDTAVVSFKVVDSNGNGLGNQTVTLGLSGNATGVTLDGAGQSVTKQTDTTGTVQVAVQSGSIPTSVWVTASSGALSTESNRLVISTGRPTQKFFSLSAEIFNIEGLHYDGEESRLTVRLADRLGAVVPDGTTVNFVTEGGQLAATGSGGTSATCSTVNGQCQVSLVSANFRPTDGRVTILAYALGEESFTDLNGNNLYDAGETFDDLGNTFIDSNKNLTYDAGEQLIPYSSTASSACPATSAFNGAPLLSVPNTCDGVWGKAHVRGDIVVTFSGSHAHASQTSFTWPTGCSATYSFSLRDVNDNPLPQGTALAIDSNFVKDGATPPATAAITVLPAVVPNTNAIGGTQHTLMVSVDNCTAPITGSFSLITTTPNGVVTVIPMSIN